MLHVIYMLYVTCNIMLHVTCMLLLHVCNMYVTVACMARGKLSEMRYSWAKLQASDTKFLKIFINIIIILTILLNCTCIVF